jgi:hypothetical protein
MLPVLRMFAMARMRAGCPIGAVARKSSILLAGPVRAVFSGWPLSTLAPRSAAFRPAFVPWPSIARPAFGPILAVVLSIAFGGRRSAYPRRQHFEIDQFVEIDRRVSHSCSLRQCANKTSALSVLNP